MENMGHFGLVLTSHCSYCAHVIKQSENVFSCDHVCVHHERGVCCGKYRCVAKYCSETCADKCDCVLWNSNVLR